MDLRPYQVDIVDEIRSGMQAGERSQLVTSPTGSGKTCLTGKMLESAAQKRMRSLFVVHRRELVTQSVRTFADVGVPHGVIAAGFMEDSRHLVQIGSIQTLSRRVHKLRPPKLIIWDECHHIAAGTWSAVFDAFPDAFHVGLTATPERLDGKGLGKYFKRMIHGPSVSWLIENGYLCKYKLFAPAGINTDGLHTRMGDFIQSELVAAADTPSITGDVIKHYRKHADGKRAVVFCVSVEHSKHVVAQFNQAGIPAAHVDGGSDVSVRDQAIRGLESGRIRVLSNVDLFGEGFDLPAIEAAILLRPTQSLGMYLQQVGRVLRPFPGKHHAVILDHAGNCQRHGLPDQAREWSLSGRVGISRNSTEASGESVRICAKCFAAQYPGRTACQFCGTPFEIKARKIEEKEGELVEIDPSIIQRQRRQEQGQVETLEDLTALGTARGYRNPRRWAQHIFQARQAKKLARGRVA